MITCENDYTFFKTFLVELLNKISVSQPRKVIDFLIPQGSELKSWWDKQTSNGLAKDNEELRNLEAENAKIVEKIIRLKAKWEHLKR